MKVVMKVRISGTRNGEDWPNAGGVVDLPKAEAEELIANNLAVLPKDADEVDVPKQLIEVHQVAEIPQVEDPETGAAVVPEVVAPQPPETAAENAEALAAAGVVKPTEDEAKKAAAKSTSARKR